MQYHTPPGLARLLQQQDRLDDASAEMFLQRPRFAALASRHKDGTAPVAVSAFNLFQTPPPVAARLAELLRPALSAQGPEPARVLEPSAGLGNLLSAVLALQPEARLTAVEIAPQCAAVLHDQDRPGLTLLQRDFLTVSPADLPAFDAVAMNPPFHMRADIRHTLHALEFLRPGGILAGICMAGPHRETALRPLCATWEPLPPDTFRATGTATRAILFSIRKPAAA